MATRYYGTYETFKTPSQEEGGALMSADNLVGDRYSVEVEMEDGVHRAWLANRFGKRVGYFGPGASRLLAQRRAEGLELVALLSYVAFERQGKAGSYFGECAVFAYHPAYEEAFSRFLDGVGSRLAEGVRPKVDFGDEGAQRIVDSDGAWAPKQTMGPPPKREGVVIMKQRRSFADKVVEQGRRGTPGCYAASILFIVAVLALVALVVASCTGVLPAAG